MVAPEHKAGPFSFLSRRRFLKIGLATGGVVLGGAGGIAWLRGSAAPVSGLRVIDEHQYRTLQSLVEVMFPPSDALVIESSQLDLARAFDEFLADEPKHNRRDLKRALTLIELGPLAFEGRWTTFSRLDLEERAVHWDAWATSRVLLRRQVSLAMRKFFRVVFFDRPEVWPHIGYPGPSLARKQART